jgi:iron complex outermembrane receptor protein
MAQFNRISLVSLLALGIAMPAFAQQAESGPQTAPQAGEDQGTSRTDRDVVIITANKREESVQDIAVAVTAITSELRDEIGLTTVQDYTNFAPGLSYSTASDRLGMRGVTRTSNNFGIRSGISNYVDGVYFSSAIPASREPIFVDRVEVVRGPQGTLYGRDSIGGALNVITKRPTEEFEGQFNMNAGNFGQLGVATTVAGPITDWARYRFGYSRQAQNEGSLTNYATGDTEGNRKNDTYYEGQLEFDVGEDLDLWIRAGSLNWNDRIGAPGARTGVDDASPYNTRIFNSTADLGVNPWFGLLDPARTQVGTQNTNPSAPVSLGGAGDRYGFNTDFQNYAHLSPTSELALEAVYHAPGFDVKYLGGYVWYNYHLVQDQDGSPIKGYTVGGRHYNTERVSDYVENRGWYSNEINVLSTWDGPLQLVGGIYQYQENYNQLVFVSQVQDPGGKVAFFNDVLSGAAFAPGYVGAPILPTHTGLTSSSGAPSGGSLMYHTNNQSLNNAYGAFLQADYQLNDQFKLTAGIRWSNDISDGREYARFISHDVIRAAVAPLFGPAAALIPVRIDATSTVGGLDPATGQVGKGVIGVDAAHPLGIYYDAATGNRYRDLHSEFEEVTGVLGIDWTPDDDTLIYGKYNRGYKPGGLGCAQVFCTLIATPFTDKELVDAVEVGFKREWPSLNLTTNATAFYYDYQGYQISNTVVPEDPDGAGPALRPLPYASYVNLPNTKTTGFELETIWYPTDNLRFLFNYGFTNPEIGDSPSLVHSLDPFALDGAAQPLGSAASCTGVGCHGLQGQNLNGNILPFSPKNKIALNGTYTWDMEDGAKVDASLSYFWQDIAFSSIFNRSYTKIPAWDQTDGRVTWTSADGNISLIGFVRNMFDEIVYDNRGAGLRETSSASTVTPTTATTATRYVAPQECFSSPGTTPTGIGASAPQSCYTIGETLRPPRTYGVELQIRF